MIKRYKLDVTEIKAKASNRWFEIYQALLPYHHELWAKAMRKSGLSYASSACPVCGGVDRFGFLPDGNATGAAYCRNCGAYPDGLKLLEGMTAQEFYPVLTMVSDYLGGEPVRASVPVPESQPTDNTKRIKAINAILEKCTKTPSLPHETYLKNRNLPVPINNPSVLYHSGLPYYYQGKPLTNGDKWQTYPAIVARISNSNGWLGMLQTYLTKEGLKATQAIRQHLNSDDKTIGCKRFLLKDKLSGGAIRLGKAGRVLAVCEGLETGLALQALSDGFESIACAMTTANLKEIEIPEQVERLVIFADKDLNGAGEQASECLYNRVKHVISAEIVSPMVSIPRTSKGIDFADIVSLNDDDVFLAHKSMVLSALTAHK